MKTLIQIATLFVIPAPIGFADTNSPPIIAPIPFMGRDLPHAVRYETRLDAGQLAAFRSLLRPAVQIPELPTGASLRIWVRPEESGAAVIVEIARP